jgi:hypothetical protein
MPRHTKRRRRSRARVWGQTAKKVLVLAASLPVARNALRHQYADCFIVVGMELRATPIPTTIRVAQHRERRRACLRQFQFFGDEVEVVERLIEAECLAPSDGDDEKAICAALARFFTGLKF